MRRSRDDCGAIRAALGRGGNLPSALEPRGKSVLRNWPPTSLGSEWLGAERHRRLRPARRDSRPCRSLNFRCRAKVAAKSGLYHDPPWILPPSFLSVDLRCFVFPACRGFPVARAVGEFCRFPQHYRKRNRFPPHWPSAEPHALTHAARRCRSHRRGRPERLRR